MVWYYADGDRQRGPISDEEFQEMVNNGRIHHETLVWTDGMENWQPLTQARDAGLIHISPAAPPSPSTAEYGPRIPSSPTATPTATPTSSQSSQPIRNDHCSQCGRGPLGLYDSARLGNLTLCRDCDSDLARHYQQQHATIGAPIAYPGTGGAPAATDAPAAIYLASIPSRFFAKMIDQLVTTVVMFIVIALTADMSVLQQATEAFQNSQDIDQLYSALRPAMLTGVVFGVLYDALLVGFFGATLGKMALGIRIVSPDGTPVRFSQAIIRAVSPAVLQLPNIMLSSTSILAQLSSFFTMFAYLIAIFDNQKRTLFDHLAGTRVVKNT